MLIAGEEHNQIGVKHYCFDPSLAPPGKSALVVMLRTNYAYWQRIYGHRLYDTEQDQVAEIVIDYMESLYPGMNAADRSGRCGHPAQLRALHRQLAWAPAAAGC